MEKFISYAQNFEDVTLWRALKHVPHGRYIDVGANHPIHDSVTKAFYDRGWRGINIEPISSLHEQLTLLRPEDINLCCAISSENGRSQFFEVEDANGLSTMDNLQADIHAQAGYTIKSYSISIETLASTCSTHGIQEIHFLKIDVEGAELQVLQGFPFDSLRPWVMVIEATQPNTHTPTHTSWEHLLLAHGYECVYFDGANRYYLSHLHPELSPAFLTPPNALDNFIPYVPHKQLVDELEFTRNTAETYRMHIAAIKRSPSWRLTKPLRALQYVLHSAIRVLKGPPR